MSAARMASLTSSPSKKDAHAFLIVGQRERVTAKTTMAFATEVTPMSSFHATPWLRTPARPRDRGHRVDQVNPSFAARRRATVLLPAPAGPSMATTGRARMGAQLTPFAGSTCTSAPSARRVPTTRGKRTAMPSTPSPSLARLPRDRAASPPPRCWRRREHPRRPREAALRGSPQWRSHPRSTRPHTKPSQHIAKVASSARSRPQDRSRPESRRSARARRESHQHREIFEQRGPAIRPPWSPREAAQTKRTRSLRSRRERPSALRSRPLLPSTAEDRTAPSAWILPGAARTHAAAFDHRRRGEEIIAAEKSPATSHENAGSFADHSLGSS